MFKVGDKVRYSAGSERFEYSGTVVEVTELIGSIARYRYRVKWEWNDGRDIGLLNHYDTGGYLELISRGGLVQKPPRYAERRQYVFPG